MGGFFTPTEAAIAAAAYALALGVLIHRSLSFEDIWKVTRETGEITASIAQNQANMSYWGLAMISIYLQNKDSFSAEGGVKLPILVDSGVSLVTKDNVAEFMEWSK